MKKDKLSIIANCIIVVLMLIIGVFAIWAIGHSVWFAFTHVHDTYMEQIMNPDYLILIKVGVFVALIAILKILLHYLTGMIYEL